MRLNAQQISNIIASLTPFVGTIHAELRLYGSRVNDKSKGGDIDLLLLVDGEDCVNQLLHEKHYILAAIKQQIGDRKIDLLIAEKNNVDKDPFLALIMPTSLHLALWAGLVGS